VHPPPQDRDLVAQDQQFDIVGAAITGELSRVIVGDPVWIDA
jgi:hypothetical protein